MSTSLVSADIHFVVNLMFHDFSMLRSYMSVTSGILTLTAYLGFRFSFSVSCMQCRPFPTVNT